METLAKHVLYQFDGRGKEIMSLEAYGGAMLKGWALMHTKNKQTVVIRNEETKEIIMVVLGQGRDFPRVIGNKEEIAKLEIQIE